jgi:tRNA A37 threonylcarbamoyladenosine modification protein TsaB
MLTKKSILSVYSDSHCCQLSAILNGKIYYFEQKIDKDNSQSKIIINLLQQFYVKRKDIPPLDIVIAPKGPGSFTGIRVLLSTAQGLAFANGALLFCPDHFEIFDHYYKLSNQQSLLVAISSKRGDYFCKKYPNGNIQQLNALEIIEKIKNKNTPLIIDEEVDCKHFLTPKEITNTMIDWYIHNNNTITPWDGGPLYIRDPNYARCTNKS